MNIKKVSVLYKTLNGKVRFTIQSIVGIKNVGADSLSRHVK